MSFSYLKKKFSKKRGEKKDRDEDRDDNLEIIPVEEIQVGTSNPTLGVGTETAKAGEEAGAGKAGTGATEEEELVNNLMNRMNEIENDLPRIKVSIDTLKSQISELRKEIERLDGTIKDVMVLYEVVSQEINPFKDSSRENPLLTEIQLLSQRLDKIKSEISRVKSDLRLLAIDGIDLDDLIYEVISGGRR